MYPNKNDMHHEAMKEAMGRRRQAYASGTHPLAGGHPADPAAHATDQAQDRYEAQRNQGEAAEAPDGHTPEGPHGMPPAHGGYNGEEMHDLGVTKDLMGSANASGLRGRAMAEAETRLKPKR